MKSDIDDRLLKSLPSYAQMWLHKNPSHSGKVLDGVFREALLKALEHAGPAKRVKGPDGHVRLVPTDDT